MNIKFNIFIINLKFSQNFVKITVKELNLSL
jgi:hypothetical protein